MKAEVSFFAKVSPSKRICKKCKTEVTKYNWVRVIDKVNSTSNSLICKQCTDYKQQKKTGYVYILYNPAWKGWLKVGMSYDPEIRCDGFQLSSPHRDYKLYYKRFFEDVIIAEHEAHNIIDNLSLKRKGEWFKTNKNDAKIAINKL